ncbi:MAG TPA: GspH/FimT family pseudopilin, partial [Thermoanaerobaculia bacterium]|nr:GspH/FimT family pseudopilin [Thermoanaerobaculia bacterium]
MRRGYSLIELVTVVAIVGLIALCAFPAFGTYRRRASMRSEAGELQNIFRLARSRAIATGLNVGVKFARAGNQWIYTIFEDGDGDGIRSDDITRGIDRRWVGPSLLIPQFNLATIALLRESIRDPDGEPLPPTSSAVRFNRSSICSFSPTGSATPGTIYITDGGGQLCALR